MEKNTSKKDKLVYPENFDVAASQRAKVLVGVGALATIVLIAVAVTYFLREAKEDLQPPAPEVQTRQAELDALYAQEAAPKAPEGVDPLNYGLEDTESTADGITGSLVFSGVYKDDEALTRAFSFDLSQETPEAQLLLPDSFINAFIEFTDRQNPSDFFLNTRDADLSATSTDTDGTRVQLYDAETETFEEFESISGLYEQNIAWSAEAGLVAYKRLASEFRSYTDLVPIKNWEVVISDIETDTVVKTIAGANQPRWSPDGQTLVVLKEDGLYAYDLDTDTETKIVEATAGQILSTSMIDLSADGRFLSWTTAKAGLIVMNEITSWDPVTINEIGRISVPDTEYYWPQFSPDGDYYVVQAIDKAVEGSEERLNPRFEVRATGGREVLRTISLDAFDFNAFFTDTWVNTLQ